jgi:hypothetical protein
MVKAKQHKEFEKIKKDAEVSEAYFVSLLWHNSDNYAIFGEMVDQDNFMHKIWKFIYRLGKEMYNKGYKHFDEVTSYKTAKELGVEKKFDEYGGYNTIEEVISVVKSFEENVDTYCEEIMRNNSIKKLYELFGDQVFKTEGKYDYRKMTRDEIVTYWTDKLNQLSMANGNKYDTYDLIGDVEEYIESIEKQSETGLPFYKSKLMNKMTGGTHRGHVTMFGAFGNAGKTSVVFNKFVMSCMENGEKLVVIANEEEIKAFRDKMVITILSHELGEGFDRNKLTRGNLKDEDKDQIRRAFEKAREMTEGDESIVKFIFMEDYIINDVKKVVRHWYNRGYINFLIDTHKVSDESKHDQRWITFVEDMKSIYKLTRNNANGMNLRMWVNFQLADHAIKQRYLDFDAIGEGKASKNEASVVMMMRTAWADEYEDGSYEIEAFTYIPDKFKGGYVEKKFKLEKGKTYYLLFMPKNRFGANNDNGQPVLILEPNFNYNSFSEVGWCYIANDKR